MGSEKGMNMPNPNLYHWRNSNGWPNYDYGQVIMSPGLFFAVCLLVIFVY